MIQEFLQRRLREETERTKLYEIAQRCEGVTVSALSRLLRRGTASIKTCEALFTYFGENAADRFAGYATVRGVDKLITADESLNPVERNLLLAHFKAGHKFIVDDLRPLAAAGRS